MTKPKTLPTASQFTGFAQALLRRGFQEIHPTSFKRDLERLGLTPPTPRRGRETGFIFSKNGLQVVVWTTFLEAEDQAREKDAGWVLIKDGDERCYFKLVPRTKYYLHNLLGHASAAKCRIEARPLCLICGQLMKITTGRGLKSRYWSCKNPDAHRKTVNLPWDHGLQQEVLDFLKPFRDRRTRYQKTLRKNGGKPGTAMFRRKGWRVNRPENKV
ncbi:MAG: hypothetical protein K9M10_01720 [Candidatus Pacebacteria bacterium]|nr:hypothetical protein [Candidatus Paceibacterota bacterium]MCF7857181.1 hypothetical protein [Candidatus Paceibacterota bacterium]